MTLSRFLGKTPEEISRLSPDEQVQAFSDKVKDRNFNDSPPEKLEIRHALLIGSAVGVLAYLAISHSTQGGHHV